MRSRVDISRVIRDLSWLCLVLAVAAFGAVVVRNVTDVLAGMTTRQASFVVVQQPSR
jgi:hypothetical protein